MNDLKSSAQGWFEHMLTEDDDVLLLMADDEIKFEVWCIGNSELGICYEAGYSCQWCLSCD